MENAEPFVRVFRAGSSWNLSVGRTCVLSSDPGWKTPESAAQEINAHYATLTNKLKDVEGRLADTEKLLKMASCANQVHAGRVKGLIKALQQVERDSWGFCLWCACERDEAHLKNCVREKALESCR